MKHQFVIDSESLLEKFYQNQMRLQPYVI